MLATSKDLLYIALALAVVFLAGFSAWAIYYFARLLQQFFKIVKEMRDRLHKIDELLKTLKEKIEHSTSYLLLIGEGIKKLVEVIDERIDRNDKKEKKKK
jgi:hypothetical protein